jgi:hypothetical protein
MALPAAVGANLWLVTVLLPMLLERSWVMLPGRVLAGVFAMAFLPSVALAGGLRRRSQTALFVAFPLACMLPELLLAGRADRKALLGSAPLPLTAAVLVAYLVAVAHWLAREEAALDPAPTSAQALPAAPVPARWQRRLRVYRGGVALAALFPSALLFWALGWPSTRDAFELSFGARSDEALALTTAAIGLLWVGLYRGYFLSPLEGHLHHDREVRIQLEMRRRQARRRRPRPAFYVAVICALVAMAAVLWQRTQ